MEYPNVLNSNAFIITTDDDFQPVDPAEDYDPSHVDMEEEIAISKAMEFADDE
jgi:hypothetical protein